jgi:hypothetical protein
MLFTNVLLLTCSTFSLALPAENLNGMAMEGRAATTTKTTTAKTTIKTTTKASSKTTTTPASTTTTKVTTTSFTPSATAPACSNAYFYGQGCFQGKYSVSCGYSATGASKNINTPNVDDFYSCVNFCDYDADCWGVNYNIKTGACISLDGTGPLGTKPDSGFDSAVYINGTGTSAQCGTSHN